MPSEKGHAKNVANFQSMVASVTGLGGGYDPGTSDIDLSELVTKLTASNDSMDDVLAKFTKKETDINTRRDNYNLLKPLVRRAVNAYEYSGADQNDIDDVKGFKRKIEGKRKTPIPADPPPPGTTLKKTHSAAQTGFVDQIEHLDAIIEKLASDSHYSPNESALKTSSLKTYSTLLKTSNTTVIDSLVAWDNSRAARDIILYQKKTGLVELAKRVKFYVRSAFGANSPEFKQISKLRFTS